MWDVKSSTLVEVYRRYVAFVYLYESAHRHVTEGRSFYIPIRNALFLRSLLPIITRLSCII